MPYHSVFLQQLPDPYLLFNILDHILPCNWYQVKEEQIVLEGLGPTQIIQQVCCKLGSSFESFQFNSQAYATR